MRKEEGWYRTKGKVKENIFLVIIIILFIAGIGVVLKMGMEKDAQKAAEIRSAAERNNEEKKAERDRIKQIKDSLPRLICWGDSLTEGIGGNGVTYPSILEKRIKLNVKNYGVDDESAQLVACRQGAIPIYINQCTIPDNKTPVQINIVDDQGQKLALSVQKNNGINPCYINDIEGNITYVEEESKFYFTRIKNGSETIVADQTQVMTNAMIDKKDNDILIIFSGMNNLPTDKTISGIIDLQKKMVEYANVDKYIIVGLTSKVRVPEIEEVNRLLAEAYGDKFLDIREYLLQNGLSDAGLTASNEDQLDIENGEIPSSLRSDSINGNKHFYTILGNKVYEKILELKYLSAEQLGVLGIGE